MIKTASWSAKLPPGHVRVGISRGTPRGMTAGYRMFRRLAPGPWFNSVGAEEYLRRYRQEVLGRLDPASVADELVSMVPDGYVPVLCCYEGAATIAAGATWCHRHLAAQWLEDRLGIAVEEVGAPRFNRWGFFDAERLPQPSFL